MQYNDCETSDTEMLAVQDLADKALSSFVIIQAALKRSRRLSVFARREDLNKRMPNFQARNSRPDDAYHDTFCL